MASDDDNKASKGTSDKVFLSLRKVDMREMRELGGRDRGDFKSFSHIVKVVEGVRGVEITVC